MAVVVVDVDVGVGVVAAAAFACLLGGRFINNVVTFTMTNIFETKRLFVIVCAIEG